MTRANSRTRQLLVSLLCILLVFTMIPTVAMPAYAADFTEVADTSTLDGWKDVFGDPNSNNISTENAGKVWTDKSVFTDSLTSGNTTVRTEGNNSLLVALSAMASNTTVKGESNVPTDTMLILDVSGSMNDNSGNNDQAENLVESANSSIAKLLNMNHNNRVGVVLYSGTSSSSTNNDAAIVLLPLGRYTTAADGEYLSYTVTGWQSTTETVSVDTDTRVVNANGTTSIPASASKEVVGATYIQKGLYVAMQQFTAATNTTTVTDPVLGTVKRTPIIVLMSDGGPTLASTNFTAPGQYNVGNGQTSSISDTTGFLSQLTAAYAKTQVEEKYDTDCKFYTLGFRVGNDSIAMSVMQPANSTTGINTFWSRYNAAAENGYVSLGSGRYVQKVSTPLEKNYVDGYYSGDAGLQGAFDQIIGEIQLQSKYFPTLISESEHLGGYVSFVDKIGKYMNVIDVKGIMIHDAMFTGAEFASQFRAGSDLGQSSNPQELGLEFVESVRTRLGIETTAEAADLIRQAYYYGQISYTNANEYSNYVGWYSDAAGNYLGFWYDGITTAAPAGATHIVKSYGYLGEVDEEHGVTESDMLYVTVRHRTEIATGEETMTFAVPAALIPTVTYEVELNDDESLKSLAMTGATSPIRLIYEVALDERINELTIKDVVDADYLAKNTDAYGNVYFYTNQYEKEGTLGYGKVNTYSYFNPSKQNELYYYTKDATVYADDQGTAYTSSSDPEGTKYRAVTVYEKNGNALNTRTAYIQIGEDVIKTAVSSNGSWVIPAGTVHTNLTKFVDAKANNETGTLVNVAVPFVDTHNHSLNDAGYNYIIGSTLGNNGRITVTPVTAIAISKDVAVENTSTDAPESFEFVIQGTQADASRTYDVIIEDADGSQRTGTVSFDANYKAAVELKDGETIYITGLAAGNKYTITETQTRYYTLTTANDVELTTVNASIVKANFVNTARGEGSLTLTKTIDHDFAQAPAGLSDKIFTMNVDLDGIGTENARFDVIDSLEQITSIITDAEGKFTVNLKDNQQMRIAGLPEGTVVKVVEENPGKGFTASYRENGQTGDGVVTITNNAVQSVVVVNDYTPDEVFPVKVTLGGTKTYEDNWAGAKFEIKLQKWNGSAWADLATTEVSQTSPTYNFDDVLRKEKFTAPGTYYYQTLETKGGTTENGITYDPTLHTFGIVVDDANLDGQLEIVRVVSYHTGNDFPLDNDTWKITANFTNTYDAQGCSVSFDILKDILNPTGSPLVSKAGFQFVLVDKDGNEIKSDLSDGVGEARLTVSYDKDDVADLDDGESKDFEYTLKEIKPNPGKPGYTYTDKEYKVVVTVTAANGTTSATAVVEGAANNIPVFTNTYDPGDATIFLENRVEKIIEGRDLVADEFQFAIKDTVANKVVAEGTNNAAGYVVFDGDNKLTFDKVGTYYYDVYEVSTDGKGVTTDKTVYNIIITVTDGGNGKLDVDYIVTNLVSNEHITFRNNYDAEDAKWSIGGTKTLEGKNMTSNEFQFKMAEADENGNVIAGGKSWTVGNEANGTFVFPQITFDKAGDYYYLITELDDNFTYITHDTAQYLVKVTVTDDLEGTLTATHVITKGNDTVNAVAFKNVYTAKPANVTISGMKYLENKTLAAGAYEFELYKSDANWSKGEKVVQQAAVKNDAQGNFSFDQLTFDKAGSYYYLINEVIPQDAVNNVKDGITYDTTVYRIRIDVTDNLQGQLNAAVNIFDNQDIPSAVMFTNVYKTTAAEVDLTFTKTLTGRDMQAGEFTYHLVVDGGQDDGELVAEITNTAANAGAAATMVIENLKFSEEGTYNYRLVEVIPAEAVNGFLNGVQYDNTEYKISIEVEDNQQGKMEVVKQTITNSGTAYTGTMKFNNEYSTQPAKLIINTAVEKVLNGRNMQAGEPFFKFTLTDAEGGVINGQTADYVKDGVPTKVIFDEISYIKTGTYTYTLAEVAGSKGGVTYSTDKYLVTVVVTDDGAGNLVASAPTFQKLDAQGNPVGSTTASAQYTNEYTADDVSVDLKGTKALTGKTLAEKMFSFVLKDNGGNEVETVQNGTVTGGKVGDFAFGALTFDTPGTYTYTVNEVLPAGVDPSTPAKDGVTYDTSVIKVTIVVNDNFNGELEAKVTYAENELNVGGIAFTNDYDAEPVSVQIKAHKTLKQGTLKAGQFTFELYEGNKLIGTAKNDANGKVVFGEIEYTAIGQHTYTVKEKVGSDLTINYDLDVETVVVEVTDNGKGQLEATVNGKAPANQEPVQFVNTDPTDESVTVDFVKKILKGRDLAAGEFRFDLEFVSGPSGVAPKTSWNQIGTNAAAADGEVAAVTFPHQLVFDVEGTYVFNLVEINKGQTINNTKYDDSTYRITITVMDTGTAMAAAYRVEEIVSGAPVAVTSNIATFENVYTPTPVEGDFAINVTKKLTGRDMDANEFVFNLVGSGIDIQGKNVAGEDGKSVKVQFPNIKYDKKGTYTYTLTEVKNNISGVTYDGDSYEVTIVVTDDGKGKLTVAEPVFKLNGAGADLDTAAFENTYKAAPVTADLTATKNLSFKNLAADMFQFELKLVSAPAEANTTPGVVQTVKNGANGTAADITFDTLTFSVAGTYKYTVSEVNGGSRIEGITYDDTVYEVVIEVTDPGDGQLVKKVTVDGSETKAMTFANVYTADPVKVALKAQKTLTGGNLTAGQFSFELYKEGALTAAQTKTNTASGLVTFDEIEFDRVGQYVYIIKEVAGNDPTINYNTAEHRVVIDVTDNGKGELVATIGGVDAATADPIAIENVDPTDAVVTVDFITKVLKGRAMRAGEFEFELKLIDKPNNAETKQDWNQTGTNAAAADGTKVVASFNNLVFDVEGEYVFEVTEKSGNLGGVTYDDTKYKVYITVTDNGTALSAAVEIAEVAGGREVDVEEAAFENTYKAAPYTVDFLTALKKELTGRELAEGEFTFKLENVLRPDSIGDNDIKMEWLWNQTIANKADDAYGTAVDGIAYIDFEAVTLPAAGDYIFEVSEVNNGRGGVDYSEDIFVYKFTVVDPGNGQLEIGGGVTCELKNGTYVDQTFKNTYEAAEVKYTMEGTKTFFKGKLNSGMFSFDLYAATVVNGEWVRGDLLETVKNGASGDFSFAEQTYTTTGTHYFMVVENAEDSIDGVIYDNTVYLVKVEITDDGEGQLVATETIQKEATKAIVEEIVFNNTYVPKTGDDKNLGLWTAMLALCASGFAGLTFLKKKEDEEEA